MRISLSDADKDPAIAGTSRAWLDWVLHRRFALLLASLLFLLVFSPLLDSDAIGSLLLNLLFSLVMLAAVITAARRLLTFVIALCFALPWLYLSWLHPILQDRQIEILANLLVAGLSLFVLVHVLSAVLLADRVTADNLCGAIAVYLLIAVIWALTYGVIEGLAPGSFKFTMEQSESAWSRMIYFSLVTLTTLGYGDITPVSPIAKIWSALQAVTGTLYMAVLIARLVSQYRR